MSEPNLPKPKPRDKFGLLPAKPGVLRGIVRNLRQTNQESHFGTIIVYDFDLYVDDKRPAVPVRMMGNDFSMPVFSELVLEVKDYDPSVRPIVTRRAHLPLNGPSDIIAYYPGLDAMNNPTDRFWTIVTVVGPIVIGTLLAVAIAYYFDFI